MQMKKTIPALPVQDINRAIDFYSVKLGFAVRHHGSFCDHCAGSSGNNIYGSQVMRLGKAKELL